MGFKGLINCYEYTLTVFLDETKSSFGHLTQANQSTERIAIFLIKYFVCAYFVCSICNGIVIILYCYLVDGYMNPDHLFIPYKYTVPWDQKTFFGWAASSTYCMTAAGAFAFVNSMFISFFVGITNYFRAFSLIFRAIVNETNLNNESSYEAYTNTKKSLCEAILFHRFSKK